MNKVAFKLPTTPTCRVEYEVNRFGPQREPCAPYMTSSVIPTPRSTVELQAVMLTRHIGISQVKNVVGIDPPKPLQRTHPALRALAKYSNNTQD